MVVIVWVSMGIFYGNYCVSFDGYFTFVGIVWVSMGIIYGSYYMSLASGNIFQPQGFLKHDISNMTTRYLRF